MLSPKLVKSNGQTVMWTIRVDNKNPVVNQNVIVNFTIPDGVSVDLAHSTVGGVGTLALDQWTVGDIPPNSSRGAIIALQVDDIKKGPFPISGIVTGSLVESDLGDNVLNEIIDVACPCCSDTWIERILINNLQGATNTIILPDILKDVANSKIHVWINGMKIYDDPADPGNLKWSKTLGSADLVLSSAMATTDTLEIWGFKC